MKKTIITLIILAAAFSLLLADPGRFHEKHGCQMHKKEMQRTGKEMFAGRILDELDLSEKQRSEIQDIRIDHEKERIDFHSEIEKLNLDLEKARHDHDFDRIRSLSKQITDVRYEIISIKIDMHENIWQLLSDDQKEKFEEMRFEPKWKEKDCKG